MDDASGGHATQGMLLRMSFGRRARARCTGSCVALLASVVLVACAPEARPDLSRPAPTAPTSDLATSPATVVTEASRRTGWTCAPACQRWRPVLDRLDSHRTRAYESGQPRSLHRVYVPGSRVLAHDLRMLRAWTRRGATVSGVRLRVLAVTREATGRSDVRLRIVDRMLAATARLADGVTVPLPRDRATERIVVLRQVRGTWRIAASR